MGWEPNRYRLGRFLRWETWQEESRPGDAFAQQEQTSASSTTYDPASGDDGSSERLAAVDIRCRWAGWGVDPRSRPARADLPCRRRNGREVPRRYCPPLLDPARHRPCSRQQVGSSHAGRWMVQICPRVCGPRVSARVLAWFLQPRLLRARKTHIMIPLPLFSKWRSGLKCFSIPAPAPKGAGCKTHLESRIQIEPQAV